MSYTWEEVMLNIDVRNEAEKERQQQQDILDEQVAEDKASAMWSLGLSVLGGALFGPAGYAAGKIIGRGVGDITHDWEDMAVDTGKFYKKSAEEFKRTRDKAATDQTQGQVFNAVTDLATMYVQAGGLKEGFEGWSDLTTFGTGEDAWTMFGAADRTGVFQGAGDYSGIKIPDTPFWEDKYIPLARTLPGDQSLFSGGLKAAGGKLKDVYATDQAINTVSDFARYWQDYLTSQEEKAAS